MQREDADGVETVVESKLVGAEDLRVEYEALLETRASLLGM